MAYNGSFNVVWLYLPLCEFIVGAHFPVLGGDSRYETSLP